MKMKKLKKRFHKYVDKDDYDEADEKAILKHLWYLNNPLIKKAVDKYAWTDDGQGNYEKILWLEKKILIYFWSANDLGIR